MFTQTGKIKKGLASLVILFFLGFHGSLLAKESPQEQAGYGAETVATEKEEISGLFAMSLEELMEMEVTTASKRAEKVHDAPGIVTVITAKEIEQFGAVNLMDVLERVPHFYPIDSFMYRQNTVSVRGIASSHHNKNTLVLINGRPARDSLEGGVDFPIFQAFPLEVIDRIEVIRGPGSVLYGTNAFTGVINIVTKKGKDSEFQASADYGTFHTAYSSMAGGTAAGDLRIYGGLKYLDSDGWKYEAVGEPPPGPSGPPPTHLQGDYDEAQLGGLLSMGYKDLTLDAFYAKSEQTIVGPIGIPPLGPYEYDKLFLDVGYTHNIRENWDVSVNGTYNMRRSGFPYPTGERAGKDVDTDDYLFEATTRLQPKEKWNLIAGGTVYYQTGVNTLLNPQPGQDPDQIPSYSNVWYSSYLQADYLLTNTLKCIVGVQANKVENQNWDFVPRLGAIAQFTDKLGAKLLYGEAYRSPYAVETDLDAPGALIGNPDLEAEQIRTFDAQIFYHSEKCQLALTGFHSQLNDLITKVPYADPSYRTTFANKGRLTAYGAELEGKYRLSSKLYILGSISYQKNEDDDDVEDATHMPNWAVKTGMSCEPIPGVSLGVFNSYYSKPSSIDKAMEVNPKPEAFHWLTANLTFDLSSLLKLKRQGIFLNIFAKNLLDEDVWLPEFNRKIINSVPGRPGRFIGAGLSMKF
ncbi:MAG: TonB-dependent receptor [Thermodesulfobacteriota bacterium]|nr:TonB-dependent receptor [Thermodesulfobacteriota bacterium]